MKAKLTIVSLAVVLAATGIILGQSKPIEQMSLSERHASSEAQRRARLKDLPGVEVAVLMAVASNTGMTMLEGWMDRLQVAVELRLRKNGIRVLTSEEGKTTPGRPLLICSVTYTNRGSTFSARTSVNVEEDFASIRTSRTHRLFSWENTLPRERTVKEPVFEKGSDLLFEAIDEFCNDYLAANPKPTP